MSITVNGSNLVVLFKQDGVNFGKLFIADPEPTVPPTQPDHYIAGETGTFINLDPPAGGLVANEGDRIEWDGAQWVVGVITLETVACSTSCTLTVNQEFVDATCKDAGSWISKISGAKSWEITVDALYQDDDKIGSSGFVDMSQLIVNGPNHVAIAFEERNNPHATTNGNTWTGAAVLPTASMTGDDNSPATYSATFMGNGELKFVPAV